MNQHIVARKINVPRACTLLTVIFFLVCSAPAIAQTDAGDAKASQASERDDQTLVRLHFDH